ncbi:MAG: cell division protein FtsK [Leptolyngbya sp. SIO4C1]|nr:cell division protein FtsK [Leptolyngbya sp. SIO4C1]
MTKPFSVTQVKLALECPRLFYLGAVRGGRTLFGSRETPAGLGIAFHQLANACAQALRQADLAIAPTDPQAVTQQLQQHLYRAVFYPYLQRLEPAQAAIAQPLWQALGKLMQRWAELLVSNLRFCAASEVVAKTLLAQELAVQHKFILPDGQTQLVQGRFDSLIYDFALQRLCVVEYKTYTAPDPSAQVMQVALYSYLLHQRLGVPIDSAVYAVLPDWQGTVYSWEQLTDSLYRLLPAQLQQMQTWLTWQASQPDPPPATVHPQLCDLCPQQKLCQVYFALAAAKAGSSVPSPSALPEAAAVHSPHRLSEVDDLAQQLVETLASFGLNTDYQGAAVGPAFIRVKLKPHLGVKVSSMLRLADDLRVQLGLMQSPLIAPQTGYVSVDLPRPDRQTAGFDDYVSASGAAETAQIAIGVDLSNRLIEADLSDPNTCHFLVGGTTGSGKSEFLRSQLLSLLVRHTPSQLQIALVDPKRVTFPEFEQSPYLIEPIIKDGDGAIALMERLVTQMEDRYQRFEKSRCASLAQYNQAASQPLPRIVCIFDEYADFMADKPTRQALELGIKRLGAMATALLAAGQSPELR